MFILMTILILVFGLFAPATATAQAELPPAPLTIDGSEATALVFDPATGQATYVVANQRLYLADGTGGWQATGNAANVESTIVDSRNPEVLWAGTGQECFRGGGVSLPLTHSTDAGATWIKAGPAGYVPLASWNPGSVVIAHDCSGLQVSRDGGANWAMPEGLPLGSQVTSFTIETSPESSAGLRVLVGVTGEGGTSQMFRVDLSEPAATVEGPLATWWGHAPVAVDHAGAILVGAPQGVLRSDDGGVTWVTLRRGLESTTLEQDPIEFFPPNLEPGSFGLTALATPDEAVYLTGVDGLYQLSGDVWQKVAELDVETTALAIEPGNGALLVQTSEPSVLRVELASSED